MKVKFLFLTAFCMLWIGCDRMVLYQFQVDNLSNYNVLIDYSVSQIDSVLEIHPGEEHIIYEEKRLGAPADFVGEEMYLFSHIKIMTSDSVIANKDFYKREFWKFLSNDSSGTYILELKNSDF